MSTLLEYCAGCEEIVKTWPDWKRKSLNDALGLMTGPDSLYKSVSVDIDLDGTVQLKGAIKASNATVQIGAAPDPREIQAVEAALIKAAEIVRGSRTK